MGGKKYGANIIIYNLRIFMVVIMKRNFSLNFDYMSQNLLL